MAGKAAAGKTSTRLRASRGNYRFKGEWANRKELKRWDLEWPGNFPQARLARIVDDPTRGFEKISFGTQRLHRLDQRCSVGWSPACQHCDSKHKQRPSRERSWSGRLQTEEHRSEKLREQQLRRQVRRRCRSRPATRFPEGPLTRRPRAQARMPLNANFFRLTASAALYYVALGLEPYSLQNSRRRWPLHEKPDTTRPLSRGVGDDDSPNAKATTHARLCARPAN